MVTGSDDFTPVSDLRLAVNTGNGSMLGEANKAVYRMIGAQTSADADLTLELWSDSVEVDETNSYTLHGKMQLLTKVLENDRVTMAWLIGESGNGPFDGFEINFEYLKPRWTSSLQDVWQDDRPFTSANFMDPYFEEVKYLRHDQVGKAGEGVDIQNWHIPTNDVLNISE